MANHLPEGFSLYSDAAICVAMANVFPVIYVSVVHRHFRSHSHDLDAIMVFLVVGIVGTGSCLLLSFFWDLQTWIAGRNQSVALLLLIFLAGAVDCMTSGLLEL